MRADRTRFATRNVNTEVLFRDSKLLGRVRNQVINLLVRMDERWSGIPLEDASGLLEAYGVRRKPGLLRCAGPRWHLPDAWSNAWVEGLANSEAASDH
jgi:hypothetical protein